MPGITRPASRNLFAAAIVAALLTVILRDLWPQRRVAATAEEVSHRKAAESGSLPAARIDGVVTYFDPTNGLLFVQDATGGVRVSAGRTADRSSDRSKLPPDRSAVRPGRHGRGARECRRRRTTVFAWSASHRFGCCQRRRTSSGHSQRANRGSWRRAPSFGAPSYGGVVRNAGGRKPSGHRRRRGAARRH